MRTIEVTKHDVDLSKFMKVDAKEEDAEILIDEDTIVNIDGKPAILYVKLDADMSALRAVVKSLKFSSGARTLGLKSQSTVFGYNPRLTVRRDYCSATVMAAKNPGRHSVIAGCAPIMVEYYKKYFPDVYNYHCALVEEKVLKEWTMAGTPFTSGIVNKNTNLRYHHDAGNFKDVLSNMIVLKHNVSGGRLVCPEYNLKFEVADSTLLIFNGQNILHGVTPIDYLSEDAYRYSIVYYSLEQMWKCMPIREELARVRDKKLERELKRLSKNETRDPGNSDTLS